MEDELKTAPMPYRSQMISRVRTYKSDMENLTRQMVSGTLLGYSYKYLFKFFPSYTPGSLAILYLGTTLLPRLTYIFNTSIPF